MTSIFRPKYRSLSDDEVAQVNRIKTAAEQLLAAIIEGETVNHRERSLAITKLEESVMWAVKGLTG